MTTEVILEHLPGEKYRVIGSGRFAVITEGNTREEAVTKFQEVAARIATTTELITVEIPVEKVTEQAKAEFPRTGWADDLPSETWENFLNTLKQQREEENARVTD